jgi:NAD dependent epimerase/dehydratase family enzyme
MKIAVTGASGFIGSRLMASLGKDAYAVSGRGNLEELAGADAVVHLAGAPVSQRWTKQVREKIRSSRVDGTRRLVRAMR